jgi:hypothetical protein
MQMYGATTNLVRAVCGNPTAKCNRQAQFLSHNFSKHQDSLILPTQSNQSNMMLSKFVLPFLAIAIASSAKATSLDTFEEEILVMCDDTPADMMGTDEMNFFTSTFVSIHNAENVIGNSDGIVLNNATLVEEETHIDTIRANLRANSPPNVKSGR